MPNNRLRIRHVETVRHAPAASRASWIGILQLHDLSVPVKAYSAIASAESQLHLMHAGCGQRVTYLKVCAEHGAIQSDEIQKGFAYSSDLLVELTDDEIAQLSPTDQKSIVIERFFSPNRLDLTLLSGRTLFLTPANLAAQRSFDLIKEAFAQKKTWALGQTVFSQKRHLVVVHVRDDTVFLHTLHDPALRRMPVPCQQSTHSPSRTEVRNLAKAMADDGDPIQGTDFHDDSQEQLAALVAEKVGSLKSRKSERSNNTKSRKLKRQTKAHPVAKVA